MVRLFSYYFPSNTLFQMGLEATLLFGIIFMGGVLQQSNSNAGIVPLVYPALMFSAFMTAMISAFGLYRRDQPRTFTSAAARILFAFCIGFPLLFAAFHWFPFATTWVDSLAINNVLALSGILALRAVFISALFTGPFAYRILVIGTGAEAAAVDQALRKSAFPGLTMVGFYSLDAEDVAVSPQRILPKIVSIVDTVKRHGVNEIIVAVRERRGDILTLNQLLTCKLEGVRVVEQSTFFERIGGEVRIDALRASWLIFGDGFRQGRVRSFVKRAFDLVASICLLVVTLPVMLVTAVAVTLESSGPVLYRQERVGRDLKTFKVFKFRSMRTDAEADGVPRWANANDSRITRIGHFIRRTRIDELPQIFNVFKGDMSFVGPRPERPYFVDQLAEQIPYYSARHSIKPGITGWAQVSYRYGSSVEDAIHKLQFDLYYVKNHTIFLDLLILIKTVKVVFSGEGVR
ncbi:MAG TPA: TIGR03013 family XrtA/PEP-CTERM system glycosyltransferase [Rhodocyclaceae bacterium]|nr:TIGR03013 family XrtA/PEP-CTERM system glycosyltransferase [Rhodocyclaceae bacterium]